MIMAIMTIREIIFVRKIVFQFGKTGFISENRFGIRRSIEFPGKLYNVSYGFYEKSR
jgi:hypothetical protein